MNWKLKMRREPDDLPAIERVSQVEREIAEKVVDCILDAELLIKITSNNGKVLVDRSHNKEEIIQSLANGFDDTLAIFKATFSPSYKVEQIGWVDLRWGNSFDLIADWSDPQIERIIAPALNLADSLKAKYKARQ